MLSILPFDRVRGAPSSQLSDPDRPFKSYPRTPVSRSAVSTSYYSPFSSSALSLAAAAHQGVLSTSHNKLLSDFHGAMDLRPPHQHPGEHPHSHPHSHSHSHLHSHSHQHGMPHLMDISQSNSGRLAPGALKPEPENNGAVPDHCNVPPMMSSMQSSHMYNGQQPMPAHMGITQSHQHHPPQSLSPTSTSASPSPDHNSNHSNIRVPPKKRPLSVPEDSKDNSYWEKRKKNNESAKRSRDARRMKEEQIAMRVVYLEQENLQLRTEVSLLKSEIEKLRCMLYNS